VTPLDSTLPPLWGNAAFLISFVFSLVILSFVIRDSWLVRAAQYLLVGVTLAYTVVLVWSNVLWPRLLYPLLSNPLSLVGSGGQPTAALWTSWLPLIAGLLLWAAGIDYLRGRGNRFERPLPDSRGSDPTHDDGRGSDKLSTKRPESSWLRALAALPLAFLVGVGLGAGIAGGLQGTFLPQFSRATEVGQLLNAAPPLLLVGLLTLVITGGVLLHLQLGTASDVVAGDDGRFPAPLRPLLAGWAWLGERAIWLTAGVIFARLFASRITLLIARMDALFFNQQMADFWRWLNTFLPGG
jgi:hypothetical protein